jgi:hypothetical protein
MYRRFRAHAAASLLLVLLATPLVGQDRICVQDIADGVLDTQSWPIPVGCQLPGCCPGCQPSGSLEWRVHVEGGLIDGVTLTFERMPPSAQKLSIAGAGQLRDDTHIDVRRGDTTLSGFSLTADPRPPVAYARLVLDPSAVKKALVDAARRPEQPYQDVGHARVVVEQLLDGVVVNEALIDYVARACPTAAGGDVIQLQSNNGGDKAFVLVEGRRQAVDETTTCTNDEVFRSTGTVNIGNVLSNFPFPPPICNQDVIVFSDDDAMTIRKGNFGNLPQDKVSVTLGNLLRAPVTVWVLRGPFAQTQTRVANDLARANQLYNTMNCGIGFQTTAINNATADPDAGGLANAACSEAAMLRSRIGFTAGQLNAYYLTDPGARGWWCGGNTIIIGASADNESLSHEFGHAFSLGHSNTLPNMPSTNLMRTGGTGRNNITEGQCFRSNVNATSTLNTNSVRVGLTRTCPDATSSNICPVISLNAVVK